jgi:hypothetical protein
MRIATSPACAIVILLALGALARAQTAEAEALFREGKRLMKRGETAQACEKFAASERLEPKVGTELNLALCRERNGQLATAWVMYIKAAAAAKRAGNDGKREAEARRRAAAIEPRLVYLTISVPRANRVDGLVIRRNTTELDPALWDQKVPVDPDEYTISGEAPGHEPWSTTVVITAKNKKVEVPALEKSAKQVAAHGEQPQPAGTAAEGDVRHATSGNETSQPADPPAHGNDHAARREARPSGMTGLRKASIVIGIIGVAAVGVGVGFGLHANNLEDQASAICPGTACGDAHAIDLNKTARRNALIANAGYLGGGAVAAGAVVMWLLGSPEPLHESVSIVPALGAGHVGFALGGAF